MHFWTSRRPLVIRLAQKCFCKQTLYSPQNSFKFYKYNNLLLVRHYCVFRTSVGKPLITQIFPKLTNMSSQLNFSTTNEHKDVSETPQLSRKDKLKRAVKDYGATVMVFHISISLMSLGLSYLVISR